MIIILYNNDFSHVRDNDLPLKTQVQFLILQCLFILGLGVPNPMPIIMIITLSNNNFSHIRNNDLLLINNYSIVISNSAMFVYIRTVCSKSNGHQSCNN